MANLRIVYNNYVDLATSITASTTASGFSADNLKSDYKYKVHRSTGTSVTYTINFSGLLAIGGVGLPATNLSPDSTIRVRLYNGVTQLADSGTVFACPGQQLQLWNWAMPLNANAFAFGGASKSVVWFQNQVSCNKIVIDLVDTNNTAGYIDCARVVAGPYWEPKYNASNGVTVNINDTSTTNRNQSGDLLTDRGVVCDQLEFDFSMLEESDKTALLQITRYIGTYKNFLISIFPDGNSVIEQSHLVYGKRSNNSVTMELYGFYKSSMSIEGW